MVKKVVKTETVTTEHVEEASSKEEAPKVIIVEEKKPKKKRKYKKRKTTTTKKTTNNPGKKKMTAREREEMLIENFVGLQHAMTNLSIKFGALSDNISNLLFVFEEAAKNFAQGGSGRGDDKDLLRKINMLLEQNKTVAKGLVLMESKLRGRSSSGSGELLNQAPAQAQLPAPGIIEPNPRGMPGTINPITDSSRPRPKPLPSI